MNLKIITTDVLKFIENYIDKCKEEDKLKMLTYYESVTLENTDKY
jgi:hypothetical protein